MADHVWIPSEQRQCTLCGLWETELSRAVACSGEWGIRAYAGGGG